MRCFSIPSVILLTVGLLSSTKADSAQVVDLGYATYQGTFNSTANITNFLGIRYAAPPVGNLRFQSPNIPPDMRAQGVQIADTQPPQCPQASAGTNATSPFRGLPTKSRRQSVEIEDCLFLNVHISGEVNPNASMPVVFWIPSGGYIGLGAVGFNGSDLINDAGGGIVAVEIQYRLGVFGFLPGAEVKKNGALNAGLLDQQFAMKWVQENIHLFGGDPSRVTIWGESAGAGSVLQHLVAHAGNTQPPLFKNAITSSTFMPSQYHFDDPIPERIYFDTVQGAGCANTTDTFQCLVNVDAGLLEAVNVAVNNEGFFGTAATVPVVDGDIIVERPMETISRGTLNGESFLGVANTFEGSIFVNPNISAEQTIEEYVAQLFPLFNEIQINETVAQYTGIGLDTVNDQAIGIMGESIFICPTYQLLSAFPGRSHKGLFAVPPGSHGGDVFYYFPSIEALIGPPPFVNAQFGASLAGSFLGLVKFGDPNIHPVVNDTTPAWSTYDKNHTEMLFNRTEDFQPDIRPITTDPGLLKRCAFWKGIAPSIPQ